MRELGMALEDSSVDLSGYRTTRYVIWLKDHIAFHINGSAKGQVSLYKGSFRLRLTARGESSKGVYPECAVMLDAREIARFYVDSDVWKKYETVFHTDEAGLFDLKLVYDNDLYLPGEDRNLFVREIILTREPDEE